MRQTYTTVSLDELVSEIRVVVKRLVRRTRPADAEIALHPSRWRRYWGQKIEIDAVSERDFGYFRQAQAPSHGTIWFAKCNFPLAFYIDLTRITCTVSQITPAQVNSIFSDTLLQSSSVEFWITEQIHYDPGQLWHAGSQDTSLLWYSTFCCTITITITILQRYGRRDRQTNGWTSWL